MAKIKRTDYQLVQVKAKLIEKIKSECEGRGISQRKLASLVPGLTHDRISKIFNGQLGHMTVDKLIEILSHLDIRADISFKKSTAA
ncbi:MAG TPA: hypothetical protein DCL41_03820 [Bdellovibrionales bacterium]|nr:hypothetical protein [Pseudobdellovibrionaceae bacterium]HAG90970.1 hypothetical protein [Bdellovibrionales bacterium]|tara:strand:- start:410 stop:667 length:258 start_codon:yes stop_codon:yes gene_type:complete